MASATNAAAINFPTPTATWSAPTDVALFDAATGGNELVRASLGTVSAPNSGDTVRFAASNLTFSQATGTVLKTEGSKQMVSGLFDSNVHVALFAGNTELSGGGYSRVQVVPSGWTIS